jgi:hypothetical protein
MSPFPQESSNIMKIGETSGVARSETFERTELTSLMRRGVSACLAAGALLLGSSSLATAQWQGGLGQGGQWQGGQFSAGGQPGVTWGDGAYYTPFAGSGGAGVTGTSTAGQLAPLADPAAGYAAPPYGSAGYGTAGYGAPGYTAPGYGAPGYGSPSFNTTQSPLQGAYGVSPTPVGAGGAAGRLPTPTLPGPSYQSGYASGAKYFQPGGYDARIGSPYYYDGNAQGTITGDPYYDHFGPGYHRSNVHGHYRFPYYSYRAPWYYPGRAVYNRDTNFAW